MEDKLAAEGILHRSARLVGDKYLVDRQLQPAAHIEMNDYCITLHVQCYRLCLE